MTIQTESKLDQLQPYVQELADLSTLEHPSKQQHLRMTSLMSIISALKSGTSASEVRSWEMEELRKAAGLPRLPERASSSRLGEKLENEWREFALSGNCRETLIPNPRAVSQNEQRANVAGGQSILSTQGIAGGYFVPQGFADRAFQIMKTYDQIFDESFSNVFWTDSGANMPFPWADDSSNNSVIVGETVQSNEVDVASFGSEQLGAYTFRSKIIGVSLEIIQDSAFPIGSLVETIVAARHARGVGQMYATGTGTGQPTGLVTAIVNSGVVPTIASGSSTNDGSASTGANSIGSQDINALYHSLPQIYRNKSVFYGTDNTLKALEGLLDKYGHPLVSYRRGLTDTDGDVPFLHGRRYAVCPSMPEIGSGHNCLVFGNSDYFITRRVKPSLYIRRYWQNPTLVQFGLIGLEGWLRTDSNAIIANINQSPWQYIQCHS